MEKIKMENYIIYHIYNYDKLEESDEKDIIKIINKSKQTWKFIHDNLSYGYPIIYLYDKNSEIFVGFTFYYPLAKDPDIVKIQAVYIQEKFQGKGYCKIMLSYLGKYLSDKYKIIYLDNVGGNRGCKCYIDSFTPYYPYLFNISKEISDDSLKNYCEKQDVKDLDMWFAKNRKDYLEISINKEKDPHIDFGKWVKQNIKRSQMD